MLGRLGGAMRRAAVSASPLAAAAAATTFVAPLVLRPPAGVCIKVKRLEKHVCACIFLLLMTMVYNENALSAEAFFARKPLSSGASDARSPLQVCRLL